MARFISEQVSRMGREAFWTLLGQVAGASGGIAGVRLLTHALNPTEYGEFALGLTGAVFLQWVIFGPLSLSFARYFSPAKEAGELPEYLASVISLGRQSILVHVGVFMILGLGLWFSDIKEWLGFLLISILFSLIGGFNLSLDALQNAARHRMIVAWHQGISKWLNPLFAIALVYSIGGGSTSVMLGYVLGCAMVLISQFHLIGKVIKGGAQRHQKIGERNKWQIEMKRFAGPMVVSGIFTWAQMASDRWSLQWFATTNDVGVYAVISQLGFYPMALISATLGQFWAPILFSRAGDATDLDRMAQAHQLTSRLLFMNLTATMIMTSVAFLLHSWLCSWLVAPEYQSASHFLPWMVLSGGFFASGQAACFFHTSDLNPSRLLKPKIVIAVLGILLNFWGAYRWGIQGVVFASVSVSFTYLGWMLRLPRTSARSLFAFPRNLPLA